MGLCKGPEWLEQFRPASCVPAPGRLEHRTRKRPLAGPVVPQLGSDLSIPAEERHAFYCGCRLRWRRLWQRGWQQWRSPDGCRSLRAGTNHRKSEYVGAVAAAFSVSLHPGSHGNERQPGPQHFSEGQDRELECLVRPDLDPAGRLEHSHPGGGDQSFQHSPIRRTGHQPDRAELRPNYKHAERRAHLPLPAAAGILIRRQIRGQQNGILSHSIKRKSEANSGVQLKIIPFEQGGIACPPARNRELQAVGPQDFGFVQPFDKATPNALSVEILNKFKQICLINWQLTEGFRFFCPCFAARQAPRSSRKTDSRAGRKSFGLEPPNLSNNPGRRLRAPKNTRSAVSSRSVVRNMTE